MAKFKLLFVDDDPCLLNGLRRSLTSCRREWEMTFVTSGEIALAHLAQHSCDVVVSDMQMPGMDGAMLLTRVAVDHPDMVRIILSGHSDSGTGLAAVGPSHQYLSKPCEPQVLISTVRRSLHLRTILADQELRKVVSGLRILPMQPRMFAETMRELDSEHGSVKSLADKIRNDVVLCAQILKLTNTSYFAISRPVAVQVFFCKFAQKTT